jgi:hypothetical protein
VEEDYVAESERLYEEQATLDALGISRTPPKADIVITGKMGEEPSRGDGQQELTEALAASRTPGAMAPMTAQEAGQEFAAGGRAVLGGVRDAAQGFVDMTGELGEYLEGQFPLGYITLDDEGLGYRSQRPKDMQEIKFPEVPKGEGLPENLARGITQFIAGMAMSPIGKGAGYLQFTKRAAWAESLFDPEQGNTATALKQFGLEGPVLDLLDSKVGEDADAAERLTARLKQATSGAIEGAVIDGLIAGIRAARTDEGLVETIRRGLAGAGQRAEARIQERGTRMQSGVDPTAMTDEMIAAAGRAVARESDRTFFVKIRENENDRLSAQQRVKQIAESKGNARPKIDDVADYFNEQHVQIYGRKLDPNDDADFSRAVSDTADEIRYQLNQSVSGRGWYDNDIRQAFENLSRIPGLEDLANNESLRVLWTALAAPTSIGQKVDPGNTKAATAALLSFLRTGNVPTNPPTAGAVTEGISGAGWGPKQKSVAAGMKVINYLVSTKGLDGFADWWLSRHTLKELQEVRKAAGLSGGPSGVGGGRDSLHLGSMVLGDKTGKYSLNLNGYQATTKDSWFSRSYNRHFGTMKNPDGSLAEAPRNLAERKRMEEFVSKVIDELEGDNLSEQDTQAVLWFFEQNLYTDLGVPSRPGSFSAASEKIQNELRSGVRAGDEGQAGAEQAGQELTDFRGVSERQRAVRAERRSVLSGAGDIGDTGKPSAPYTRESDTGDGGDGLLVFTPEPASQRQYEAAGLSVPVIREVPATDASAYNKDMIDSMSGHTYAAQVEIKSPDELANARLFRTESGSGFAIKDGDIVAVFASKSEPRGGSYSMLQAAVEAGGRKLDAFDTFLPSIYKTVGFRPVARVRWNDEFAPPNWSKETFDEYNNGEPDVVLFVYDPDYFGAKVDVPRFDDFDEAVRVQDAELKKVKPRVDEVLGNGNTN